MAPSTRSLVMQETDEEDWFAEDDAPPTAVAPATEFDHIERLLRPLTRGDPAALDLLDDAAVLPSRPGYDLVITKDAMVAGVHFLPDEALDVVARKLLRTNLSDLAAKAAEPYGYFLAVGWPSGADVASRETFARGLAEDGAAFDISLLGGDTVTTSGPLVVSATLLGWAPQGGAILRRGAKPGDRLMVSGTIGDGWLGLLAQWGEVMDADGAMLRRYRQPEPRVTLRDAMRIHAKAAADVSDGLLADSSHIAKASGCRVRVDLERLPLSPGAQAWLDQQPEQVEGRISLASGGDDYEIVCAVDPNEAWNFRVAAAAAGVKVSEIGEFVEGEGVSAYYRGRDVTPSRLGWLHG
ncbi:MULTISPECIES: thiamine-phosphate kinase [Caulobacter]|jgi:thiamine-monophosphate kinase|uniref:Thiamine-monophosphate kinase n=1 Tax=Caulobacter vibrioides OR37 TaxID=1292034 RepID=R0EGB7_CAUVI|nr:MULTISPECIES: thiamine-phosphate kinase [Caulobacter]ENZ80312.1 thiamine-phosphate kinase [Caulobacter vibrioides OR37]MBQ1563319.1 thiamine-phosphate kinase [Caulobacter sp.]